MTWPWLAGTAVALFGFIMNVLNVPTTLADNWQRVTSAVRWVGRVRSERRHRNEGVTPDVAKEIALEQFFRAVGTLKETPASPLSSSPRWIMRPGYRYTGGAVSTEAVMDLDCSMESVTSEPRPNTLSLKSGRWTAGTTASAAGTTDTA